MDTRRILKKVFYNPRFAAIGLLGISMVWGATFVMVADTMRQYPVFAYLGWRFFVATIAFFTIFTKPLIRSLRTLHKPSLHIALAAGVFLSLGYIFQTSGLLPAGQGGTTPARTAFITGLYVVLVPIGQFVFRRQRPRKGVIIGVIVAMTGLWFLSGLTLSSSGGSVWVWGDSMVLICACAYTAHMLVLGKADESYDTLLLTVIQLATVAVICAAMSVVTREHAGLPPTSSVWFSIVFCGVVASAFAFAIQTWAQQVMVPARAALILVLEPAFGGLFGWLIAGQVIWHEGVGAALMLGGMMLSELWGTHKSATAEPSLEGPAVIIED